MQQPHVVKAFITKAQRISQDIERMARFGRDWIEDRETTKMLWRAQQLMDQVIKRLGN